MPSVRTAATPGCVVPAPGITVVTRSVALLRQRCSDSKWGRPARTPVRPRGLASPSGRRDSRVACSPRHRPLIPGAGQRRVRGSRPVRAGTDPGQSCATREDREAQTRTTSRLWPGPAAVPGGPARAPGTRRVSCRGTRRVCASAGLPDSAPTGRCPGKGWTGRSRREVSRAGQEARLRPSEWPRPGQPRRNPPSRGLAADSAVDGAADCAADGAVPMARTVTAAVSGRGGRGPP
jgi:hypothetical protein